MRHSTCLIPVQKPAVSQPETTWAFKQRKHQHLEPLQAENRSAALALKAACTYTSGLQLGKTLFFFAVEQVEIAKHRANRFKFPSTAF